METTLASASERQIWISKYLQEYVRASQFKPYMGKDNTNIIIVKYEMETERGKTINIPLITRLRGDGVTGSQMLEGNEEAIGNYNWPISIDWRRHGVTVPKSTQYKTEIDFLNAAKPLLRNWEAEKLRDDLIQSFHAFINSATDTAQVLYGNISDDTVNGGRQILATDYIASETVKNNWLALNSDRVLFGHTKANNASNNHANSLANLAAATDIASTAIFSNAKLMAKTAIGRRITPYQTKDGREFFVAFMNSFAFRDLTQKDTAIINANRDARAREGAGMDSNPLFQDGDVIYNGVIYRQVEESPRLPGVGAASSDVAANFLAGQQALGLVWGQEPTPVVSRERDYGFRPGVGIEELLGTSKLFYNGLQQGVVTVYTSVTGVA